MKFPKIKKIKIDPLRILRRSYPVTIIIVVVTLIIVAFFLYQNVYQTLSYAKIVTNLKQKVTSEYINMVRYEDIIKRFEKNS